MSVASPPDMIATGSLGSAYRITNETVKAAHSTKTAWPSRRAR